MQSNLIKCQKIKESMYTITTATKYLQKTRSIQMGVKLFTSVIFKVA